MMTSRNAVLALAFACFCTSAQAQVIYLAQQRDISDPTRFVRFDIEKAIRRALTPPSRRAAQPTPPQATPPAEETREQWRQRLFDEMRSYCTKWPDDTACGPNALSGGSEDRRTAQGVGAARLKPSHGQNNLSQRRHIDRSQESAGHIRYSAEAKSLRGPRR
jgi:hypothetical protein